MTAPSFSADVKTMFLAGYVLCMRNIGVSLDDFEYMSDATGDETFPDHANGRHVFARLSGDESGPQMGPLRIQSRFTSGGAHEICPCDPHRRREAHDHR